MSAPGNDQVIIALERLIAEARRGHSSYLVATMVGQGQKPMGFCAGASAMAPIATAELQHLAAALDIDISNKTLPPRRADIPADRVCYNVPISPLSYDFACWLVDAEMTRIAEGAPAPLKVCFWFGRDGKTGFNDSHREQMFRGVVRPMLDLIGAVEDPTAADGRFKQFFVSRDIAARAAAGAEVSRFRAPAGQLQAMRQRFDRPLTITLREAGHNPYRNSNLKAWVRFARHLKKRGENVVFVRDTAQANLPIEGFATCPEASVDLHARMALYETARMNLFVSNGPVSLGYFGTFPWLMFLKPESDSYQYEANTPSFWRDHIGVEMGGQFPWCRPDQRIIWKPDNYEHLIAAWHEISADGALFGGAVPPSCPPWPSSPPPQT